MRLSKCSIIIIIIIIIAVRKRTEDTKMYSCNTEALMPELQRMNSIFASNVVIENELDFS